MKDAVILDFVAHRQKRLEDNSPSLSVAEELILEIKKLIARLKSSETISHNNQP